jgi:hypothetical protein
MNSHYNYAAAVRLFSILNGSESNKICPSGGHDYSWTVFSLSWHYKNPTKRVGVVQSGPHHHLIAN